MWAFFLSMSAILLVSSSEGQDTVYISNNQTRVVTSPTTKWTVMCKSDRPLVGCNFRVWYTDTGSAIKQNQEYPVMDFSNGANSRKIKMVKNGVRVDLYEAEYSGRGLLAMECGVKFTPKLSGRYLLGCRGRANTGDWWYNFMSFAVKFGAKSTVYQITSTSSSAIVNVERRTAKIMYKETSCALKACTFFVNGRTSVSLSNTTKKINITSHEAELNDGECSLTLKHVTEADNGLMWYKTSKCQRNAAVENLHFEFIVVPKAPSNDVSLKVVDHEGPYHVGDVLKARCTVKGSRPDATITWLLEGEQPIGDIVNDVDREWRWPWGDATITQTLSYTLKAEDQDSTLTCRVAEGFNDSIRLQVQGVSPTVGDTPIELPASTPIVSPASTPIVSPASTEASNTQPTVTDGKTSVFTSTPKPVAPTDPEVPPHPATPSAGPPPTGRNFPGDDSTLVTVIAIMSVVLLVTLLVVVVYARAARKCCFRQTVVTSDASNEEERSAVPAALTPKPSGKPRAPSPGRSELGMELGQLEPEERVDYAEIVGAKPRETRTERNLPEDTTYAELSFH